MWKDLKIIYLVINGIKLSQFMIWLKHFRVLVRNSLVFSINPFHWKNNPSDPKLKILADQRAKKYTNYTKTIWQILLPWTLIFIQSTGRNSTIRWEYQRYNITNKNWIHLKMIWKRHGPSLMKSSINPHPNPLILKAYFIITIL